MTDNLGNLYVVGALASRPREPEHHVRLLGHSIAINNTGGTTLTDNVGQFYVAGTGASSVAGRVNLTTTSVYTGGAFTISNSFTTALRTPGALYVVGDLNVSGNVTCRTVVRLCGRQRHDHRPQQPRTDEFGLVYTSGTSKTLTFSGNVQVKATAVTAYGDFTISGATHGLHGLARSGLRGRAQQQLQPLTNPATSTGAALASVTSRNYTQQLSADPWPGCPSRCGWDDYWTRSGTYNDEYGNVWVPGNSSSSIVLGSTGTLHDPVPAPVHDREDDGLRAHQLRHAHGSRWSTSSCATTTGSTRRSSEWAGTGTFYGLMVINESTINFTNGVTGTPSVEGAVFAGCPYDPTHTDACR